MSKTMVKVRAIGHDTLIFQTISLENGVSPRFLLPISEFEEMDRRGLLSVKSITDAEHPLPHQAVFIRITSSRQLLTCFRWLNSLDASGSARTECVQLPYDDLEAFVGESKWGGVPTEWKRLSLENHSSPRLVFLDKRNLRRCLGNKIIRRKLVRCLLRGQFSDPEVQEIHFRDSAIPYSFTYQEICDTPVRTVGSLTLFCQDDPSKAYYHVRSHKESNPARPEYRMKFDPYLDERWDL